MAHGFTQLPAGLWVRQSRSMHYNFGAFISQGKAALVDPGVFAEDFQALQVWLTEQRAAPEVLILTHSHWDHVLGPEQFPGVRTLAQRAYVSLATTFADDIRWGLSHWEKHYGLERREPFTVPLPQTTFDQTETLALGELSLRLEHVPGHAADQLAIYHADTGTLWASDILSDVEIPYVSHSLAAYTRTLEKLADWEIRALVPGHGTWTQDPVEIRARFAHDQRYLRELGERVAKAVREGKSVEETVAACADMRFRLPEKSQFDHRLNVESAYLELGGQADPKKVGWNKDWKNAEQQWEG